MPLDPKVLSKCILYVFPRRQNEYVNINMCRMELIISLSAPRSALSSSRVSYLSVWHHLTTISNPSPLSQSVYVSLAYVIILNHLDYGQRLLSGFLASTHAHAYIQPISSINAWSLRNAVFRASFLCLDTLMASHRSGLPSESLQWPAKTWRRFACLFSRILSFSGPVLVAPSALATLAVFPFLKHAKPFTNSGLWTKCSFCRELLGLTNFLFYNLS